MIRTSRYVAVVAAALAVVGGLASCRSGSSSDSASSGSTPKQYTVTIGTDLSSAFSSACCGIPIANGFASAINAANAAGGINGAKVIVQRLDDRADVTTGLANFQQALSSDTLGYFLTSASTVLNPVAARATTQKIVTSSIGGYKGGIGVYPYVYNSLPNSDAYVDTVTQFAATQVPSIAGSKMAFFAYDSTLTETFQKALTAKFTSGGWKVAYNQLVPSSAADFSVAAGNIASAAPKVVVVDLLEGQLPTFVSQLRARGVTAPIINFSSNIQDSTVAKINDQKLFLTEFTAPASDTSNPAIAKMDADAQAAGLTQGDQNPFFVTGYVQGQIVVAALKKCAPNCTRESFNSALENTTVPGNGLMAGNPGFSPADHVMVKKLVVVKLDPSTHLPAFMPGYGL
jgi:branched-chain amino acid transport system substrate-binding protein